MARTDQLAWILPALDSIRSDMSVFHRIDDIEAMPALRFIAFVERLAHYEGALRHEALARIQASDTPPPAVEPVVVDAAEQGDFDAMSTHPVWSQIGQFSKAPLAEDEGDVT